MDDDRDLRATFLPPERRDSASRHGALKGLRKHKPAENLLRMLLPHVGCGHSLRETAVRAKKAGPGDFPAVSLMKRLKKSGDRLQALCAALFRERGLALAADGGFQVRAFDATTVKEPGKTGSLWRIRYSVSLPSLICDFFRITATAGPDTGESFLRFPIRDGDRILADRGYSIGNGIRHVVCEGGGCVTVRVNTGPLVLKTPEGAPFDLPAAVGSLMRAGSIRSWQVKAAVKGDAAVPGRIRALRKTREAIRIAEGKLKRDASRKGNQVQPDTVIFARCVILFTTFPEPDFSARDVLERYRVRWQVEPVFKRFKSLAQSGRLPKYDDESARAWLYGKILVALPTEKLIHHASAVFPWGTTWKRKRSVWCDFKFACSQIMRVIEPALPLARMIAEWNDISGSLAEPLRQRQCQISGLFNNGNQTS